MGAGCLSVVFWSTRNLHLESVPTLTGIFISPPRLEDARCWRAGAAQAIRSCSEKAQISTTYFCPQTGEKTHGARDGGSGWLNISKRLLLPQTSGSQQKQGSKTKRQTKGQHLISALHPSPSWLLGHPTREISLARRTKMLSGGTHPANLHPWLDLPVERRHFSQATWATKFLHELNNPTILLQTSGSFEFSVEPWFLEAAISIRISGSLSSLLFFSSFREKDSTLLAKTSHRINLERK